MPVQEVHEEDLTLQVDVNLPGKDPRGATASLDERRIQLLRMDEEQFRAFVDDQLRAGSVQFEEHRQLLQQNTALTQQTADNTREMVELFGASKRGVNFLQSFGAFLNRAARWLSPILLAGGALWAIIHGHPPRGGE